MECTKQKLTKIEAITLLNFINSGKVNRFRRQGKYRRETRYYHCPFCNSWHLTSRKDEDKGKEVDITLVKINEWKKLIATHENERNS